jgi:thymidylate synthase
MVNAWNAGAIHEMALPPCHYGFQIYINDGKMDLMWQQRSADVFLGLPYDFAMYGLLLLMLAKGAGYTPGELLVSLGDCHLYNNHIDQAKQQLDRSFRRLPFVSVDWGLNIIDKKDVSIPKKSMINISGYDPHPAIKAELNVGV